MTNCRVEFFNLWVFSSSEKAWAWNAWPSYHDGLHSKIATTSKLLTEHTLISFTFIQQIMTESFMCDHDIWWMSVTDMKVVE